MPIFYYTAKNQASETKVGKMDAKDEHALSQSLHDDGYILTSAKILEDDIKKTGASKFSLGKLFAKRVSLVDKLMFTRHLAVMIGAGFSLHQGLEVLAKQTENKNFRKILDNIVVNLKKGQTLADSLAEYPRIFNEFFVNMIKVGEKGGSLEEILKILARYLKREHDLRAKITGAMFYPIVILVAMVGVGILMMLVVMPKLTVIFEEMNFELPFTTKFIIVFSKFVSHYFYIAVIAFLILAIIFGKVSRTKKGKKILSLFFLKLPFFNKITKKVNCARFSRSFSSLMESGVPVIESLQITANTVTNTFYCDSLNKAAEDVKKGKKIQEAMEEYKDLYPVLVNQMVGVGEQTGELSEIIGKLADFYEEEVKNITDNLASIIEPVLMIILGVAVGFFAISMIQPMYSMMQGI